MPVWNRWILWRFSWLRRTCRRRRRSCLGGCGSVCLRFSAPIFRPTQFSHLWLNVLSPVWQVCFAFRPGFIIVLKVADITATPPAPFPFPYMPRPPNRVEICAKYADSRKWQGKAKRKARDKVRFGRRIISPKTLR